MTATPPWEPSAWLREAVSNRLKAMAKAVGMAPDDTVVVLSLTDRPRDKDAARIWEFTCDRCGTYCPPGVQKLHTGSITMQGGGVGNVHVTVGLCDKCAMVEQLPRFEKRKP